MDHHGAVIFWIIIVSLLESGDTVEIHDSKDKSICKRYHRVTATRKVPYDEEYYNRYGGISVKTNYREENFTKWEALEMCCEGYEPHEKAEEATTCVPVCLSDCLHGECVRPNQCICEPGYRNVMNELTEYNECVPVCSSGCQGGTCIGPNTCECGVGYLLAKDQSSCKPICIIIGLGPQGCGYNASCVAPHTCECDHGYIATVNSSKIRDLYFGSGDAWKMTNLLENGKPFSPGDVICRPSCEPECGDDSSCVAPNKCECKTGYGRALMPEDRKNGSLCVPACKQPCINGFCAAPNICACLEGYKPHWLRNLQQLHWLLTEDLCEPVCHEECVNGKCTRPGDCECFDGYEKLILGTEPHETSKNICTPVCPGQCPNGSTCVSPGQCRCNAGYVLDYVRINETGTDIADTIISPISPLNHPSQQFCRPKCLPDCPTGYSCTAPNHCRSEAKVDDQYVKVSANIRIVNSTGDCGDKGALYEENGACGCEYRVDGKKYIEPGLCAIIFTYNTEEYFELRRLDFYFTNVGYAASFNTTVWMFRRSKCRTLILSKKIMGAVSKKTEHCYLLEMHGFPDFGTVEPAMRPSHIIHENENETIICLSTVAETMCGPVESKKNNGQVGRVVLVVVGTITSIALIAGFVAAIYLTRQRLRKIGVFGATSGSNGNIMERSETMESSLHTLDGPHV